MFDWLKGKKKGEDEDSEWAIPEGKTFVLFVCTANLSRSPMAEVMLRRELEDWDEIVVGSCGTKSVPGFKPTPETLTVLQTHGYPTAGLVTHRITASMVNRANFIFVMGEVHLKALKHCYPKAAGKVYLITDFSEDEHLRGVDVLDPHEKRLDAYLEVYYLMVDLIPRVADFIIDGPSEDWQRWYDFYRRSSQALGR